MQPDRCCLTSCLQCVGLVAAATTLPVLHCRMPWNLERQYLHAELHAALQDITL